MVVGSPAVFNGVSFLAPFPPSKFAVPGVPAWAPAALGFLRVVAGVVRAPAPRAFLPLGLGDCCPERGKNEVSSFAAPAIFKLSKLPDKSFIGMGSNVGVLGPPPFGVIFAAGEAPAACVGVEGDKFKAGLLPVPRRAIVFWVLLLLLY